MRKMRTWRECLIERITSRERAIGYLQAIFEDYQIYKNPAVVLRALQTVVEAQGGVFELAKQVDMDPQVFSKMLSNKDMPLIDTLGIVLKALGYHISIQPIEPETSKLETYTDA
ncbi:MAG: hypothetical protein OXM61_15960 [Candidatus Poribacteria bacterium]|nr:hypothetical protein [Candidatus Poribacteria bacterium]